MYIARYDANNQNGFNFFLETYDDQQLVSRLTEPDRIQQDTAYHWILRTTLVRCRFDGMLRAHR
jgi:hypothetical protein